MIESTEPTPEEKEAAKQHAVETIAETDEFILFAVKHDEEGEEGIQSLVCVTGEHIPAFGMAFDGVKMSFAHALLGEMLEKSGSKPIDLASLLPEDVEVPDEFPAEWLTSAETEQEGD